MADDRLRVIVGPTAAGKSALALALAEQHAGAIISADSRQLYRGFDLGTAKPTADERRRVPHYGIDVLDPTERYSAASWAHDAARWIADAEAAGRTPVVVGGTGFYIRALVAPLFEAPPLDGERRAALDRHLTRFDVPTLRRWVRALDPPLAHLGRTQLLRAIETSLLSGRRLSALQAAGRRAGRVVRYLVVDPPRDRQRERIARRVDAMFDAGWAAEVAALARTVAAHAPAWSACGYAAVREAVVAGDGHSAREQVIIATRQYAKRQRTWLRHQLADADVTYVDSTRPGAMVLAERWWTEQSGWGNSRPADETGG